MFIFFPQSEPPHCPECGKLENTVTTCRHCGYEYEEEDDWTLLFIKITIAVGAPLLFAYTILTLISWLNPRDGSPTLWEVIKGQWEWARHLRIW